MEKLVDVYITAAHNFVSSMQYEYDYEAMLAIFLVYAFVIPSILVLLITFSIYTVHRIAFSFIGYVSTTFGLNTYVKAVLMVGGIVFEIAFWYGTIQLAVSKLYDLLFSDPYE